MGDQWANDCSLFIFDALMCFIVTYHQEGSDPRVMSWLKCEWDNGRQLSRSTIYRLPVFVAKKTSYPRVDVYITMENHHFLMGNLTISMAMFNGYVKLPEGSVSQVNILNSDHLV